jgi:hypothetical protein
MFAEEFLNSCFLQGNPYREHKETNFDAKIFEYEPINKFYDLPLVKRLAFESLQKVRHLSDPLELSSTKLANLEKKVTSDIQKVYNEDCNILIISSGKFEYILEQAMRVANGKKYSAEFATMIHTNPYLADYVKALF